MGRFISDDLCVKPKHTKSMTTECYFYLGEGLFYIHKNNAPGVTLYEQRTHTVPMRPSIIGWITSNNKFHILNIKKTYPRGIRINVFVELNLPGTKTNS